jgi:membrane peptidoglycan carboxypeptidase
MSQTYTANCYQSDHVATTDITNMEANFATLRSTNSGDSAPGNMEKGLQWFDSSGTGETKKSLKIRNDANDAWLAVLVGSVALAIWMYRDDTDDGWDISTALADRVLAFVGGSGAYSSHGAAGETWANLKAHTHPGGSHTHSHVHPVYIYTSQDDPGYVYNVSGVGNALNLTANYSSDPHLAALTSASGTTRIVAESLYTKLDETSAAGSTDAQNTADVRPAAAIGTLQYPDI